MTLVFNKRLIVIVLSVAFLLMIPFTAMQFSNEVKWTGLDFMTAGILLLSLGLLCDFTIRKVRKIRYRIAICLAILAVFAAIWVELAVGIF